MCWVASGPHANAGRMAEGNFHPATFLQTEYFGPFFMALNTQSLHFVPGEALHTISLDSLMVSPSLSSLTSPPFLHLPSPGMFVLESHVLAGHAWHVIGIWAKPRLRILFSKRTPPWTPLPQDSEHAVDFHALTVHVGHWRHFLAPDFRL
jgi:hypothetical protein